MTEVSGSLGKTEGRRHDQLVHATAVVIGTMGLLIVGPSGSGKSSLALRLMAGARRAGHFAALVSDDQVIVTVVNGRVIASAPPTIKGLIEVRGSDIHPIDSVENAVVDVVIRPVEVNAKTRISEEFQKFTLSSDRSLPLLAIDRATAEAFFVLSVILPGFPVRGSNWQSRHFA